MSAPLPKYVSRDSLLKLLKREFSSLSDSDLVWWKAYSIAPLPVRHGEKSHYVVAVAGQDIIFFADDEDEFGVAKLQASEDTITDYGLVGDLMDAIGIIQQRVAT
jgi:hypothetical protein